MLLYIKNSLIIITCSLALIGCKKKKENEQNPEDFDRNSLLENLGDNIIKPRYDDLNNTVNTLNTSIANLTIPVTTTDITNIRTQFKTAYLSWQSCSSFEFGPAANTTLKFNLNTYPSDTSVINNNITNGGYNLGTAANIAAIGFPALDFLLFNDTNVSNTTAFFNDVTNGNKRLTYLKDVSVYIKNSVNTVHNSWQGSYLSTFKNANGTDVGSSIGLLINSLNLDFEKFIRDGKVGIPVGKRSLGTALPEKSEAFYSKYSLPLLEESISSLQNLINGNGELTGSIGFDDYLNHLGAKHGNDNLSTKINNQFASINQKLSVLTNSIDREVIDNQANVNALYDELQKLVVLLKVDLSSALSVLITYQDNDGD